MKVTQMPQYMQRIWWQTVTTQHKGVGVLFAVHFGIFKEDGIETPFTDIN